MTAPESIPHRNVWIVRLNDLDIRTFLTLFQIRFERVVHRSQGPLARLLIRQKPIDRLLYLDPDILVTQPLDHLFENSDIRHRADAASRSGLSRR